MLASCLHALDALGPAGLPALMGALFLLGLAGGVSHCAAMCGPFVLAQVVAGRSLEGGRLARLSGAMLLPYHLGRGLGYAMLGALAGGFAAAVALVPWLGWVPPVLLLLAALAMLAQAAPALVVSGVAARVLSGLAARVLSGLAARATPVLAGWLPRGGFLGGAIARHVGPLLQRPGPGRSFLLGVLLSALPCGLLYGALAAAAGSGSALAGALAMAAFVAGTVPALAGLALLGRIFRRQAEPWLRRVAPWLYLFNALVLAALALRLMG